ncbi:MAG: serine/threonine protein kinase [Pseudomonadota bacterium]
MNQSMWGNDKTKHFYKLAPHTVLDDIEKLGYLTSGRCLALNSLENRVYEIEIIVDEEKVKSPSDRFLVAKFYRPGRWSEEQILEEHQFLFDLEQAEIPVISPLKINGQSLFKSEDTEILYSIFPKRGGRLQDELKEEELKQIGRTIARLHIVGKSKEAKHRLKLDHNTYGQINFQYLKDNLIFPKTLRPHFEAIIEQIIELIAPMFENAYFQRIHGDCHLGNILWNHENPLLVDFDDMVTGPPVQDIWHIASGRDNEAIQRRNIVLTAYETMNDFDRSTVRLIEPLRTLRYIHFMAWISKRWEDESFKRAFPMYGSEGYWSEQMLDLREQFALIQEEAYSNQTY